MKKLFIVGLSIFLSIFVLSGCKAVQVQNINETFYKSHSEEKVEKAILLAGNQLKWDMQKVNDGLIKGTLVLRKHKAVVRITYNNESFRINYVESSNLGYDEEKGTIHSNYNGWVNNLSKTINNNLKDLIYDSRLEQLDKETQMIKEQTISETSENKILDISENINNANLIDIENAIVSAGESLGWKMAKQSDGLILGRLTLRSHSVIIKIEYSTESYSINYLTSENLNFDSSNYSIHRNYNGWIENLRREINIKLNFL